MRIRQFTAGPAVPLGLLSLVVVPWVLAVRADAQEAPAEGEAVEASPEAPPSAGADAGTDVDPSGVTLSRDLRTVEEDVSGLKERVFRSKATLQLLKELLVDGAAVGSRVKLKHVNNLGGAYSMESVQYYLDGKTVYSKVDPGGGLDATREFQIHDQTIPPGEHKLQVDMVLRGRGYRVFSYLRKYQFRVQSNFTFEVAEGRATVLDVVTESSGALKNFVDRPSVRYEQHTENVRTEE